MVEVCHQSNGCFGSENVHVVVLLVLMLEVSVLNVDEVMVLLVLV